jgi:DNA-binding Lrp family transcriptional regulator
LTKPVITLSSPPLFNQPTKREESQENMSRVLQLLLEGERLSTEQMGDVLGISIEEVSQELDRLKSEKILLGWRPILNPENAEQGLVRAVIEVKISPEREGGFDRQAMRISRFDEVDSCQLMSGGFDLLVIVKGKTLHQVAAFVSERLATIGGVLSTATHFMLRSYKEQGHILVDGDAEDVRPAVSP